MFKAVIPQRPETLPFDPFLARKDCLSGLFKQTRKLNLQVFWIIERLLFANSLTVVKYVKNHFHDLQPLVEEIAKTQNGDAGKFLHTLAVSDPEVLSKIQSLIRPHFKNFPVATVLDFMVACPDMKKIIKDDEFPKWVLRYPRFTVSDVELVTVFHTQLWTDQTAALMFVKTDIPRKMKEVLWIHDRPDPPFQLTPAIATCADKQIMAAFKGTLPFTPSEDCVTTRDPYLYVRFFLISLANPLPPSSIRPEVIMMILNSISDESEPVAAAAMQVFAAWVIKFEYKVPAAAAYRAAARAVYPRTQGMLPALARCMLHIYAQTSAVAGTILCQDNDVKFDPGVVMKLKREKWMFPNIIASVVVAAKLRIYDYNSVVDTIGGIMEYLDWRQTGQPAH
jgi:hypothetical protein